MGDNIRLKILRISRYLLQDPPLPTDMRFSVGLRTCGVVLEIPHREFFLRSPCAGVELGHAVLSAG